MTVASSVSRPEVRAKFFYVGQEKLPVRGVTYGPFRPRSEEPDVFLPSPEKARADLGLMKELGANVLRLYHVPPRWFMDLLAEQGMRMVVTVPWMQHVTFLNDRSVLAEVRRAVRAVAHAVAGHPALFAVLVGNEIPTDIVRWHGADRVRTFLDELITIVKEIDEGALVSYASYPPTEFLLPRLVDFVTFNVYLERRQDFRAYLARLQNLAEEKPLLLGEFGMDTQRNGEEKQAEVLGWHLETVARGGAAGTILFSFTDEWFRGGHDITDWAFGLVTTERTPKKAFATVRTFWREAKWAVPFPRYPKVSVVVCSYNGAPTLRWALDSLDELSYPDYEVILVDDGSKDRTQEIVKEFEAARAGRPNRPVFKNFRWDNRGLSAARNQGMSMAEGEIVAYTDSDCVADRDWLTFLVTPLLEDGEFKAVGGPNISPPAHNWIQACVAAGPGSPSHVLVSDQEAEHVPGCNMAYWKWALEAVEGFDVEYRKAGDDVDLCWRIMEKGWRIGFSPAAVVWHHRRFTVKAYFSQQRGYGEAESLLRFKHLIYFGRWGGAKWRGTVYGTPRFERIFSGPLIYRGSMGMGLFQTIYPHPEPEWAVMVSSLEWVLLTVLIFLVSLRVEGLRIVPLLMIGLTLAQGLSWMARARVEPKHDSVLGRLLLLYLAVSQPLVRGYARYTTWLTHKRTPIELLEAPLQSEVRWSGPWQQTFWTEKGATRGEVLHTAMELLEAMGWKFSVDAGWGTWDLLVFGNRWWRVYVRTVDEYHGGPKVLVRARYWVRPANFTVIVAVVLTTLLLVSPVMPVVRWAALSLFGVVGGLALTYRCLRLRDRVASIVQAAAERCGFAAVPADRKRESGGAAVPAP